MTRRELNMVDSLMANISQAYLYKDWELLRMAYFATKQDRKILGVPPFVGSPNLEHLEEIPLPEKTEEEITFCSNIRKRVQDFEGKLSRREWSKQEFEENISKLLEFVDDAFDMGKLQVETRKYLCKELTECF